MPDGECSIGKHQFNRKQSPQRCIVCNLTRKEINKIGDLKFMEQLLNCKSNPEDRKHILKIYDEIKRKYDN